VPYFYLSCICTVPYFATGCGSIQPLSVHIFLSVRCNATRLASLTPQSEDAAPWGWCCLLVTGHRHRELDMTMACMLIGGFQPMLREPLVVWWSAKLLGNYSVILGNEIRKGVNRFTEVVY